MGAEINDRSERIFGMQQASGVFGLDHQSSVGATGNTGNFLEPPAPWGNKPPAHLQLGLQLASSSFSVTNYT